ncbi:PUA domain-containing protein [Halobacterium litoreum]|uniref:PUA domain-containing protein n=1 Tax=Halobacterium litoreum TaxID=2039234 RepID=A0ABD5NGY5_9EURY|nr:PUA domain-containing protein [Halobacterium litoreum]UHH12613.1 pseudouridine synthase [Halobacterium litoreum]
MQDADLAALRTVADYQFGAGASAALFPEDADFRIQRSSTGRPQQVARGDGERLVSVGLDGRLTLGTAGGQRLADGLDYPSARVVVGDDSEPFVRDGKNVFAKFVQDVDADVRAGDEVAIVHEDGHLLAVGRAELDAQAMRDFDTGMAVMVRDGVEAE